MDRIAPMDQSWVELFKDALLKYLQQYCPEAVKINSWSEELDGYAFESGCDTCGHGADAVYTLTIFFHIEDGTIQEYVTEETFGSILSDLCYYR